MNRRQAIRLAGAAAAWPLLQALKVSPTRAEGLDVNAILHDPDTPEAGNPKGDVTIVAFFDYNCPFCKKSEPALTKVVKEDSNVRLVYKDWPILSEASVFGAQMALAAKYQDRYQVAHDALMTIPGHKLPKEKMRDAVAATDIDMPRLQADLQRHGDAITALLKRTLGQADALGLQGTPVYLIGPFMIAQAMGEDGFKKTISQTRARQAGQ